MTSLRIGALAGVCLLALAASLAAAQPAATPASGPEDADVPANVTTSTADYDYVKRVEMIPMRDGVKLYTVIVIPKGAKDAPMILTRTPYNAKKRAQRMESAHMLDILPQGDADFVRAGYIRVFQDIRGKYGSEGDYIMTRPPIGPLNTTKTDDTTDAFDTIDWLVKNIPESNGRVGMLGSSYEGWTVVMALLGPHPALKVTAPESPMVDGWMGDDWFHYGAFRNPNLDYITGQTSARGEGAPVPRAGFDDYENFITAGSTGAYAKRHGLEQYPFWRKLDEHPAYDGFWQGQALDKLLAAKGEHVPTMWEQGLWDQEDEWGAIHGYDAMKAAGYGDTNYLVMGPWRHSGANYNGSTLGALSFDGDTGEQWRRDVLLPFFNQYLKPGSPAAATPRAFLYDAGENHWDRYQAWPVACATGCDRPMTPLFLEPGLALGFQAPAGGADSYVSDPAKPVTYLQRPVAFSEGKRWQTWLVNDQRDTADGRPDVLTYETEPLTKPVKISGAPTADLYATTTGTDGDFVVKVIDVYPDTVADDPPMGGYELNVSMDIFRGRYRDSFEHPTAIPAGKVQRYRFDLPPTNHVFLPGHRIMVQIQSSWFPLYDRNPQTFVPDIFDAKPSDYKAATVTVLHQPGAESKVWLPVVGE
jgi:putative CocE/NonD family hydrolase